MLFTFRSQQSAVQFDSPFAPKLYSSGRGDFLKQYKGTGNTAGFSRDYEKA